MKKVILTLTGLFMLGVVCVNAQVDSASQTSPSQSTVQEEQQPSQGSTQYSAGQRVRVPSSQVPTSLRQTLKSPQYSGWENSTIYLDKNTNEYSLDMMDGNTMRSYRFDQNGKAINDKGSIKSDVPPSPEAPANDGSPVK